MYDSTQIYLYYLGKAISQDAAVISQRHEYICHLKSIKGMFQVKYNVSTIDSIFTNWAHYKGKHHYESNNGACQVASAMLKCSRLSFFLFFPFFYYGSEAV